jgi:hypothetical protein
MSHLVELTVSIVILGLFMLFYGANLGSRL